MDITKALAGKTIMWAATDEELLVLGCTDGTEGKIKWGQDGPEFAGKNVRIVLPSVSMGGKAAALGG